MNSNLPRHADAKYRASIYRSLCRAEAWCRDDVGVTMKKGLQLVLNQLTRREYSVLELTRKLSANGYTPPEINEILAYCHAQGLQSDRRFTEQFCRVHVEKGDGPIKIKQLLKYYGIASMLIQDVFNEAHYDWIACAQQVLEKHKWRFEDLNQGVRQKRFLMNRGFPQEVIQVVLGQRS